MLSVLLVTTRHQLVVGTLLKMVLNYTLRNLSACVTPLQRYITPLQCYITPLQCYITVAMLHNTVAVLHNTVAVLHQCTYPSQPVLHRCSVT